MLFFLVENGEDSITLCMFTRVRVRWRVNVCVFERLSGVCRGQVELNVKQGNTNRSITSTILAHEVLDVL